MGASASSAGTGTERLGGDTQAAHPANLNDYSTWHWPASVFKYQYNAGGAATSGGVRCCSFVCINER